MGAMSNGPKKRYLWTARRVATQANPAGGAIALDITFGANCVAELVNALQVNSGTNTCAIWTMDEDFANMGRMAVVGSAAGTSVYVPSIGTDASVSANRINSTGIIVGPGQNFSILQSGAGAQNDTMTVGVCFLLTTNETPTWSVARSTNPANVTLAASTISAANTMIVVYL